MIRTGKTWLAAALAASFFSSTSVMAAGTETFAGILAAGEYTFAAPPYSQSIFIKQVTFQLAQDSVLAVSVTGTKFAGVSVATSQLNLSTGQVQYQELQPDVTLEPALTYTLGTFTANQYSGFNYFLEFRGTLASAALPAGGTIKLSVQPVPEPGTWGLMALGLAGVAAASRRRST